MVLWSSVLRPLDHRRWRFVTWPLFNRIMKGQWKKSALQKVLHTTTYGLYGRITVYSHCCLLHIFCQTCLWRSLDEKCSARIKKEKRGKKISRGRTSSISKNKNEGGVFVKLNGLRSSVLRPLDHRLCRLRYGDISLRDYKGNMAGAILVQKRKGEQKKRCKAGVSNPLLQKQKTKTGLLSGEVVLWSRRLPDH